MLFDIFSCSSCLVYFQLNQCFQEYASFYFKRWRQEEQGEDVDCIVRCFWKDTEVKGCQSPFDPISHLWQYFSCPHQNYGKPFTLGIAGRSLTTSFECLEVWNRGTLPQWSSYQKSRGPSGPDFYLTALRAWLTSSFMPTSLRPCDPCKGDHHLHIYDTLIHVSMMYGSMIYVSTMHISMMHTSLMHICMMHLSIMHIFMMHVSIICIHEAYFQDAYIHDAYIHDACIHDAYIHDACIHHAYIYDPWSWCMCVWCTYGSDSPGRGFWPKYGIFLKKVEHSCNKTW